MPHFADKYDVGQTLGKLPQPDRKGLLARIPAFPPIVLRLLDLLARDDVEIRELVALISSDPAFSAQILRVANSPLFGFRSRIDSLQSALVVLGLRRVRSLSMTVATANHMKAALCIEELSRCWRHMLACALLTEELARSCRQFEERAYTAGLLHDVGRLGLLLAYPIEYAGLLRNAGRNVLELLDCEREVLGMDHCEAGRFLAAQWNLPEDFQIIAARHHDPQQNSAVDLLTLVHLGCRLADSLGFWVVEPIRPDSPEEIQASLPPALAKRIKIDANRWRESVERRIRCYSDPDATMVETYELAFDPAGEEPELPVAELARLRLPDPNAGASLPSELLKLVGIGLAFTILIVALVYFAVK
ncbi:MAG: HDOD domain-containing protein [Bryobacteraceae bacterium]